jgi:hypothetical protein
VPLRPIGIRAHLIEFVIAGQFQIKALVGQMKKIVERGLVYR